MLSNGGRGWWMLVGLLMKSNGGCGATCSQMRAGERLRAKNPKPSTMAQFRAILGH